MRDFVGEIDNNCLYFREICCHSVIRFIKGQAVMYIPGGNYRFQHKAMFVTVRMDFIRKLSLMLSLYKQTSVRIGYAPDYRTSLLLLPADQLLL